MRFSRAAAARACIDDDVGALKEQLGRYTAATGNPFDANSRSSAGLTLLHNACSGAAANVIAYLLTAYEDTIDVNIVGGPEGFTPLICLVTCLARDGRRRCRGGRDQGGPWASLWHQDSRWYQSFLCRTASARKEEDAVLTALTALHYYSRGKLDMHAPQVTPDGTRSLTPLEFAIGGCRVPIIRHLFEVMGLADDRTKLLADSSGITEKFIGKNGGGTNDCLVTMHFVDLLCAIDQDKSWRSAHRGRRGRFLPSHRNENMSRVQISRAVVEYLTSLRIVDFNAWNRRQLTPLMALRVHSTALMSDIINWSKAPADGGLPIPRRRRMEPVIDEAGGATIGDSAVATSRPSVTFRGVPLQGDGAVEWVCGERPTAPCDPDAIVRRGTAYVCVMHLLAQMGTLSNMRYLVDKHGAADAITTPDGYTTLMAAARCGYDGVALLAVLKYLVGERGHDPTGAPSSLTASLAAADNQYHLLARRWCEVWTNRRAPYALYTAVHIRAGPPGMKIAQHPLAYLLSMGCAVDPPFGHADALVKSARDYNNTAEGKDKPVALPIVGSPLHVACAACNYPAIKLLTDAGADTSAIDSNGRTPLGAFLDAIAAIVDQDDTMFASDVERAVANYIQKRLQPLDVATLAGAFPEFPY